MYTLQLTLVLVLAFMLFASTEARYLWNPNEQPQPVVHENSQPFQGDHIISLTPPPSSHNSAGESSARKESPSSPPPSSTHATTSANPKPTSNEHKPAAAASSKDTKPPEVPATHASTPAKSDTPKGTTEQHTSGKSVSTTSAAAESPSISSEASASPTNDTNSSSGSGLVAGIVIGLIALIGSIAAFVMVRRKKRTQREMNPDPFTMGFGSHDPPYNTKAPPQQQQQQSYYQQPQPSVSYSTPPMTPMSHAPPYQPQPYYTPTLDKTPTAIPMEAPHGYPPQENPPAASESLGIFNVVSTYSPTLSDELDIQLGDRIEITVEYDDGWCQGINVTRGNTKGVFPRHCVDQYPGEKPMDGPPQLELGEMKRVSSMYMTYT